MTVPRTWVTSEVATASMLNTIRDGLIALGGAKALVIGLGDPGGAVITTGVKRYIEVPYAVRITGWTILADQVGSIVIDLWKDSYANFAPTVADTITGSEKPTLAAAQKNQDLTLTTWATDLNAGDILAVNVDSAATVKQVTLTLRCSLLALL